MYAGAFNTGKLKVHYEGDTCLHVHMYWNAPGGEQQLMTFQLAQFDDEFDLHDIFPSAGMYYVRLYASNDSDDDWADTGQLTVYADVGHMKLRR